VREWLWIVSFIFNFHRSSLRVTTASKEQSHWRVKMILFSYSYSLSFSSLLHFNIVFWRTLFLLSCVRFLIIAYSWESANSLTAQTRSFNVENEFMTTVFDDRRFMIRRLMIRRVIRRVIERLIIRRLMIRIIIRRLMIRRIITLWCELTNY
jgi:hypothetical protein